MLSLLLRSGASVGLDVLQNKQNDRVPEETFKYGSRSAKILNLRR